MFRFLSIFAIVILSLHAHAADASSEVDSLKRELRASTDAAEGYALCKKLTKAYIYISPDSSEVYIDRMEALAITLGDEEKRMAAVYDRSVVYRMQGRSLDAIALLRDYVQYLDSGSDTLNKAKANYQLGASYLRLDSFYVSTDYFLAALKQAESIPNPTLAAQICNALGVNMKMMARYDRALEYFQKAESFYIAEGDSASLLIVYNGIGILYRNLDSLAMAKSYFSRALALSEAVNNKIGVGFQNRNLGMLAQKAGDFEEAEGYFLKALEIRETINDPSSLAGSYYDLGTVYTATNRYVEAEKMLQKADKVFTDIRSATGCQLVYEAFGELYEKQGDLTKALHYTRLFHSAQDSLLNNDLRERVANIEERYQSAKKDKKLVEKDLQLQTEGKKKLIYLTSALVFLIIALAFWWSNKQLKLRRAQELLNLKREFQVKALESLLEGEEKERNRIAKELHDGVNGDLSALKYKLSNLLESNRKEIKEAIAMVDHSCEQVRAISHNLTPPSLERLDLVEVLENYCQSLNMVAPTTEISYQHLGDLLTIDQKTKVNLFRLVQELLSNSLKYAEATLITVQTSLRNGSLHLSVDDNGKGFEMASASSEGLGIQNIHSRARYLNAEIDYSSNANGTFFGLDLDLHS